MALRRRRRGIMRLSARSFCILAAGVLGVFTLLQGPGRITAATGMPSCAPGDPVVWVNTSTKVYHEKGDQYYGNTKHGEYECKSAADKAGDHLSKETGGATGGATRAPSSTTKAGSAATAVPLAAPSPAASASGKHHKTSSTAAATPAPSASPSSKKHHKSAASPAPAAT
jgi:hypothetical protein